MTNSSTYVAERKDDLSYYLQRARTGKRLFGKRSTAHVAYVSLAIQARKDLRAGRPTWGV